MFSTIPRNRLGDAGAESSSDEEGDAERELKRKRRRERDAIRRAKRRAEGHESDSSDDVAYSGPQPAQQTIEWRAAYHDHASDEVYCGEVAAETGLRHGLGVVVYLAHEHRIYEGEWRHGREHGRGRPAREGSHGAVRRRIYGWPFAWQRHLLPAERCYLPRRLRENASHGRGEYRSPRGGFYVGDWKDNKRHGRGRFELPDGSVYDGEWVRDSETRQGYFRTYRKGLLTEAPGSRTASRVEASASRRMGPCTKGRGEPGKREGRGAVKWPNGANYEGRFKDDKIDGQGLFGWRSPFHCLGGRAVVGCAGGWFRWN